MTPLFSITNTITRDEYQTFNMVVLKKEFHFVRSLIIINVCALFIMMSIMGETLITDFKHFWWGIIFIVVMLCCTNWFYLTRPKRKANKAFDKNKLIRKFDTSNKKRPGLGLFWSRMSKLFKKSTAKGGIYERAF